ncbi:DUF58 domain-containing protein [Naasia sp. SYSU D00948]|uniref:DUF58 domain-containing protein n=1 Tax=Naasia sp. SYSU D00948 TaxID=2817379 RepID=UPI001B30763B|nr:DUF58 domain-containing protein [Naasia sp. SYSU D00948]
MTAATEALPRRRWGRLALDVGLPRLTPRGWAVLGASAVAVIVAFSVGWRDLFYVGLILGALLLGCALAVRARVASLSAARRLSPDVVSVGQPVTVQIRVTNNAWIRASRQLWRDLAPRGFDPPPYQVLPALGARGDRNASVRLDYHVEPRERGVARIGPLLVERTDPFGLTLHEARVGQAETLTVLPRITPLEGAVAGRTSIADSSVPAWKTGHGHDDVIAREYRAGDALRHVHWRATAHRGELMVRQEQSQDEARAVILLDTRRDSYSSSAAFEWAVEFAASLLVHLTDTGVGVMLMETAPAPEGTLDVNRTAREALLDLATVRRRTARSSDYLHRLGVLLAGDPAPVYAVLGSAVTDQELRELAPQKARASSAALVLVGDPDREPPEEVWFAGWRSASSWPGDDVAGVWARTSPRGGRS